MSDKSKEQAERVKAYSDKLAGKASVLSEKEYQHFIMRYLEKHNGYIIRNAKNYDRLHAIDRELLFQFLNDTQPDAIERLSRIYKGDLEETIVGLINTEVTKGRGCLVNV